MYPWVSLVFVVSVAVAPSGVGSSPSCSHILGEVSDCYLANQV